MSKNYGFMLDKAVRLHGPRARILDFGCGTGAIVAEGLKRGLSMSGADTFEGHYVDWHLAVPDPIRNSIRKIEGTLPFDANSFDVVIANQVFEHIPDKALRSVLQDIRRVLRPGGHLLCSFPVRETWYEGHFGLYFLHRMRRFPRFRHQYLKVAHQLGLGLYRQPRSDNWAKTAAEVLDSTCYFHRIADIRRLLSEVFGNAPRNMAAEHLDAHLAGTRFEKMSRLLQNGPGQNLKNGIMHMRSGVSWVVENRG
jgi:SAM-dependent methyltransferase